MRSFQTRSHRKAAQTLSADTKQLLTSSRKSTESAANPCFLVFGSPSHKTCAVTLQCSTKECAVFSCYGARSVARLDVKMPSHNRSSSARAWALAAAAFSERMQSFSAEARWFRAPGGDQRLREQPRVAPSISPCIEVYLHHLRNSQSRRLLAENAPLQKLAAPRSHLAHGSAPRGGVGAFGAS